ncbi:MAG: ABC transporter ATP-binding protein, partial [Oscillospiraceae bacterium]|nr:ABC transporter ATP-binding protein [Oscillospiraceae bacterium]
MPPRRGMPTEKAKDFKGTLGKVINYLGGYRAGVIAVMICAVLSAVFHIVPPKILGKATTALSEGLFGKITGSGEIDFGYIGKILVTVMCLHGVSYIFSVVQ